MASRRGFSRRYSARKKIVMRRLISLLCLVFSATILVGNASRAEEGVLDLFVANINEQPVAGAILSPRGAGSASAPTDKTGRTRIKLSRGAKPGKWVTLQLIKGPGGASGWYLVSPWKGRAALPSLDEGETDNYLPVIVARQKDKLVLSNASAMSSIAAGILLEEAATFGTANPSATQRQLVLAAQAELMGVDPAEVDQSLRTSLGHAKDSYERGLLKLYNKAYSAAVIDLAEFLHKPAKLSPRTTSASFFLGQAYQGAGDYKSAIQAYKRTSESDVLTLSSLGLAYKLAGEDQNAEAVFFEALTRGSTEGMSKAQLITNLRRIYDDQKQPEKLASFYAAAESSLEQEFFNLTSPSSDVEGHDFSKGVDNSQLIADLSTAIQETNKSGDRPKQAWYMADLGSVYFWSGDYEKALSAFKRAEPIIGANARREQLKTILGIGATYQTLKQYDKALPYFTKAVSLIQPSDNSQLEQFVLQNIGASYLGLNQNDNAIKYFKQAAAAIRMVSGADDPSLEYPLHGLATAYYNQRLYADAEKQVNEVLTIRQTSLGANSVYAAASLVDLAELSHTQKKYSQSEDLYRQALAILEKTAGTGNFESWNEVLVRLAGVYEEQNKLSDLQALYEKSLTLGPWSETEKARLLGRLAKVYVKEGKPSEAQKLYQQALEIIAKSDPRRQDLTEILKDYAVLLRATNQQAEAAKIEILVRARAPGVEEASKP